METTRLIHGLWFRKYLELKKLADSLPVNRFFVVLRRRLPTCTITCSRSFLYTLELCVLFTKYRYLSVYFALRNMDYAVTPDSRSSVGSGSVICWTYLTLRRLLPACRLPPAPPAGPALPAAH